ncbi:hypothetical protein L209DRAFT_759962 [Thermothelomyces heterothallicus CBS 203.75]
MAAQDLSCLPFFSPPHGSSAGANRRAPGPTELQRVYGEEGPFATQDARDGRNFWFQLLRQASTTTVGLSCCF